MTQPLNSDNTGANAEPSLVKISVLARMSGVPAPTIKHYMREGLLPGPAKRTSRNVAYYDSRLAARVRTIKELQQSRYLPLKVIGDLLEPPPSNRIRADLDEIQRRQLGALAPAVHAGAEDARGRRTGQVAQNVLTRARVTESFHITAHELDQLEAFGLLEPVVDGRGEKAYKGSDVELLTIINLTRDKGMGDLFSMDIIEPYISAIQTLVQFEIDLFRRRVLGGAALPQLSLDEIARLATNLGGRLVAVMRDKLVVRELQMLGQAPQSDE